MARVRFSDIAHRRHPIAAPVAPERARALLRRVVTGASGRVVDLGCGHGEWLTMLLSAHLGFTGVGVDSKLPVDVDERAAERGVADRVRFVEADAADWSDGAFDLVLCIGATHAFGGLDATLTAMRRHLRGGGRLLLGDGIWEHPPTPTAQKALDASVDDLFDLAALVDRVRSHGFEPIDGHVSTLAESDDYEWCWTGSVAEWALTNAPDAAERQDALNVARKHRDEWLRGYRGQLGFVTLALADTAPMQ